MKISLENMLNRIVIVLFFCLGMQSLAAQDQDDCSYLLEDAREAYDAGMVELVPELLLDCILSNGLAGEAKKEAYKLVINSYLSDYMATEADSLMDGFVSDFPDYRAESSDPQEFIFLLDAHLVALGINPNAPLQDTLEVAELRGRRNRKLNRIGVREYGNSLGFSAGVSLSMPNTLEGYSVGDPGLDDSHFGLLPGFLSGAELNLKINRRLETTVGLAYNLTRFKYSATPLSFTSYVYEETQHLVQLPLSLLYKFNPESRTSSFYMRAGFAPSYLFSASGRGSRTIEGTQDELIVEPRDITDSRENFNLDAFIGGGIRIPLNSAFIFTELRVNTRILQANREDSRYADSELSWVLYHIDSDFRVHQVAICAGICWDLTRTR